MKEKKSNPHPTQGEVNDYFNWGGSTGGPIDFGNDDLVCCDCKFRLESLLSCEKYSEKPGSVIYNKPCDLYQKE